MYVQQKPKTYNDWTRKQVEAYRSTRHFLYTLFGGAKGGGKSVGGSRIFQCDISNYRSGIFIVMRKNYTVLRNTTVRTFEKFMDPDLVVHKANNKWFTINGNQIWFWAADQTRDTNYEKTRGLEATEIMFDEASEGTQELYEVLPSLLRQPAISLDTGREWTGNIYMTANPVPGTNYLKRNFIDLRTRKNDGKHNFIQSLPDHNPLLPKGYIDRAFGAMNPALLQMLRYGDWDVEQSEFQIIPSSDVNTICWTDIIQGRIVAAGIDIGLGRPDLTVVYTADDSGHMRRHSIIAEYDTVEQVNQLSEICQIVKNNDGEVWIDNGSVGKGVADNLTHLFGSEVIKAVSFGESPVPENVNVLEPGQNKSPYQDRRAQMYFWAREDVMASSVIAQNDMPPLTIEHNDELIEEFENTYFIPVDGKLRIEPKDLIKSRIGRSPDDADSFVLCNAARRSVKNRPVYVGTGNRSDRRTKSSGITSGY